MNKIKLFVFLLCMGVLSSALAKDGYRIKVNLKNTTDTMVYLVHYYAEPLPKIYKTDSASVKKGEAILENKDSVLGGIYMILPSSRNTYFEFLLKNGDDFTVSADIKDLPASVVFKNSDENVRFYEYVHYLKGFGDKQEQFKAQLSKAKRASDTAEIREKAAETGKELTKYRRNYASKFPNTLLGNIFNGMDLPDVPEGKHFLADGSVDSNYNYLFYKQHYWDKFNFKDDRLIHTPIYDSRLEEYMNRLVIPYEDSVIKEGDLLLAKIPKRTELFKYTLFWLTYNAQTSKIMGMDRVFVHLVENYYMKGDAFWLDRDGLQKYYDEAARKSPNLIGRIAPDLMLKDVNGKSYRLSDFKAKYTLLVFWEPTCGHCMTEVPKIDSVYRAALKAKGVKLIGVRTDDPVETWQDFIKKHKLDEWLHLYDADNSSNYRGKYDIRTTPSVYLLDENKIIIGKKLDHSNIATVIEIQDKKGKQSSSKK
jgi:peroxiredoxin